MKDAAAWLIDELPARSWDDAVKLAGAEMVRAGAVGPGFVDEMLHVIEELGPYCVVAPGVALAHASPSALVARDAIVVAKLREPLEFGHPYNDPVRVLIVLANRTTARHIRVLAAIANALDRPGVVDALCAATTVDEALAVLGEDAGAQHAL